jgi:hypothetical protein
MLLACRPVTLRKQPYGEGPRVEAIARFIPNLLSAGRTGRGAHNRHLESLQIDVFRLRHRGRAATHRAVVTKGPHLRLAMYSTDFGCAQANSSSRPQINRLHPMRSEAILVTAARPTADNFVLSRSLRFGPPGAPRYAVHSSGSLGSMQAKYLRRKRIFRLPIGRFEVTMVAAVWSSR